MISDERKQELTQAYEANIAAGQHPYAGVDINDFDELQWIFQQRMWSGAYFLPDGLRGADLRGADLRGANLRGADLSDADLSDADLRGADLRGANLRGANLSDANLSDANLSDADLSDADLRGADLSDADLSDANLSDANLDIIRNDIYDILDSTPLDVPFLLAALKDGKVDGSTYRSDCNQGCLVGTLEISQKARLNASYADDYECISHDPNRPAERWFLAIRPGMPVDHPVVALTITWVEERLAFYQRVARLWTLRGTAYETEVK